MFTTGNEIVDKVGMINLEGNIIPHAWYQHFKMPNGKPDLNSMIILSEIVYWYRPTTLRDETSGKVIGIKKRFKADLLQRSYDSFAEQFGLTKRQVKESIDRLCVHGVIWREFRTLKADIVLNNVLYIGINPKLLCDVSFVQASTTKRNTLLRSNVPPSNDKTSNPPTLDSETNTENTTENTTDTLNVPFDDFWNLYDKKRGDKDKIEKKWQSLKDSEREAIMNHLPLYKKSQPNKKYRKDPSTYLNNKSWNDEIIFDDGQQPVSHDYTEQVAAPVFDEVVLKTDPKVLAMIAAKRKGGSHGTA